MKRADHLLGNNIEPSFPFDNSTAEQYLDDMFDHYQAETVEPTWTTKFPTYAEVAWEVEHIMESRRELDLPAWSKEEAEAFLKEKQSAIRSIVWDAGEVYIRDMMRESEVKEMGSCRGHQETDAEYEMRVEKLKAVGKPCNCGSEVTG